jgi:hypothetical protein
MYCITAPVQYRRVQIAAYVARWAQPAQFAKHAKVVQLHQIGSQCSWFSWSSSSSFRRCLSTGQFRARQVGKRARYRFARVSLDSVLSLVPVASRLVASCSSDIKVASLSRRVCLCRAIMFERLRRGDEASKTMSEVSPEKWGRSPQRLLFLQGEIGQLPQNHYNAITLRPSLSGGYLCLSPAIAARNARVGCN